MIQRRWPLILMAAIFSGCADTQVIPTHHPATTSSVDEIRLSAAEPMDHFESDDVQVNLTDKLDPPAASQRVYFGEADEYDSDDQNTPVAAVPLIAIHIGDDWRAVPVAGPGLQDAGWKYVGAGPARHEVWGVLDSSAGESKNQFVVAHSTDGAKSLHLKVFQKPCKLAEVADFAMSRDGHGGVTLSLDTDCGPHKAGLYHYETNDDGKTWSANPRYEPDAMLRADTVPDDEQPEPPDKPKRTIFKDPRWMTASTARR